MNLKSWGFVVVVWVLSAGCDASDPARGEVVVAAPKRQTFGMNMTSQHYFGEEWLFNDVMLTRSGLYAHADGQWHAPDRLPAVGPDGWPLHLDEGLRVGVLVFRGVHARRGTYRLSWTGRGRLQVQFGATGHSRPGTQSMLLEVGDTVKAGGVHVVIEETDVEDPIAHLKMVPVKLEGETYAAEFFERMAPIVEGAQGVMRNMDWVGTNNRPFEKLEWSDRAKPDDPQEIIAYEHQIAVWNRLKTNPWICIPAPATDGYCRELFKMLKRELHPDAVVRVEYSNEVWNGTFKQYQWCVNEANRLGLKHDFPEQAYMLHRSKEIWAIWEEVFGDRERLVRVAATQMAYENRVKATAALAEGHADELALGAYFGGGGMANQWAELGVWGVESEKVTRRLKPGTTEADVLEALRLSVDKTCDAIARGKKIADKHGLRLVAYEAGQHLVATGANVHVQALTDLCIAVNGSQEMGVIYQEYLRRSRASGLELICMFSSISRPGKWGSWGQWTQTMNDEQTALQRTPKGDAVLEAAKLWRTPNPEPRSKNKTPNPGVKTKPRTPDPGPRSKK